MTIAPPLSDSSYEMEGGRVKVLMSILRYIEYQLMDGIPNINLKWPFS